MTKETLSKWDSAELLKTEADISNYLEACFEDGDPQLITHALGVIAKARGMTQLAKETGISREGLYKALNDNGNPEFSTVIKVFKALDLRLSLRPISS